MIPGHRRPNPPSEPAPARIEMAHAGGGQWLALVLDQDGGVLEAISGSKAAVLAAIRERWPDLPVEQVPFIAENPAGIRRHAGAACAGRAI